MMRYRRIEVACRALCKFVLKVAEEQTRNHTRPNHVLRQLVLDEDQHVAVMSAYTTKYDGDAITETTSPIQRLVAGEEGICTRQVATGLLGSTLKYKADGTGYARKPEASFSHGRY